LPLPQAGEWRVIFNSDEIRFGGSGIFVNPVQSEIGSYYGCEYSGKVVVPPLGTIWLQKL